MKSNYKKIPLHSIFIKLSCCFHFLQNFLFNFVFNFSADLNIHQLFVNLVKITINPSSLQGTVTPPTSKSHTIRSIIIGSLADGSSLIKNPLLSLDGLAPINSCEQLGASFSWNNNKDELLINGIGGNLQTPSNVLNIGNSGTSLYFLSSVCALLPETTVISGDESIVTRPIKPLLEALNNLGAFCYTTRSTGTPPAVIKGPLRGGTTSISGTTSQFTSSLLLACPLAKASSIIKPDNLQEKPYVDMTLSYLDNSSILYNKKDNYKEIIIEGGQNYRPLNKTIPADFSSAAFLIGGAVLSGDNVRVSGLDFSDYQADKVFIDILQEMGARIKITGDYCEINKSDLQGMEIDLSQSPDLLPIVSVVATQANGTTKITNVEHARIKETDRIACMHSELSKLGAHVTESRDGLTITKSDLHGTNVTGYSDHRITMSLIVAGLISKGKTTVDTVESIKVTYPNFIDHLTSLGANIE